MGYPDRTLRKADAVTTTPEAHLLSIRDEIRELYRSRPESIVQHCLRIRVGRPLTKRDSTYWWKNKLLRGILDVADPICSMESLLGFSLEANAPTHLLYGNLSRLEFARFTGQLTRASVPLFDLMRPHAPWLNGCRGAIDSHMAMMLCYYPRWNRLARFTYHLNHYGWPDDPKHETNPFREWSAFEDWVYLRSAPEPGTYFGLIRK